MDPLKTYMLAALSVRQFCSLAVESMRFFGMEMCGKRVRLGGSAPVVQTMRREERRRLKAKSCRAEVK